MNDNYEFKDFMIEINDIYYKYNCRLGFDTLTNK